MKTGEKVALGLLGLSLVIGGVVVATRPAQAAVGTGIFAGQVLDQSGNPVSGVLVSLGAFLTSTNASGYFSISNVPAGTYSGSFSKSGYQTAYF